MKQAPRPSTWMLMAMFVLALVTYLLVRPPVVVAIPAPTPVIPGATSTAGSSSIDPGQDPTHAGSDR